MHGGKTQKYGGFSKKFENRKFGDYNTTKEQNNKFYK